MRYKFVEINHQIYIYNTFNYVKADCIVGYNCKAAKIARLVKT